MNLLLIRLGSWSRVKEYYFTSKCHALINGKYSPDIEDVKAVAKPILRHRVAKMKAESEGISIDQIIEKYYNDFAYCILWKFILRGKCSRVDENQPMMIF